MCFVDFLFSMDPKSIPIHLSDLIGSYVFETFVDFFTITRITAALLAVAGYDPLDKNYISIVHGMCLCV